MPNMKLEKLSMGLFYGITQILQTAIKYKVPFYAFPDNLKKNFGLYTVYKSYRSGFKISCTVVFYEAEENIKTGSLLS